MLEGFPEKTPARQGSTARNVALTVVASVAGLAVLGVLGSVFGIFDALRAGSTTTSVAASAAPTEVLDPAPALVCEAGTVHDVPAPSGSATGDDTPLAAAERWAATVPGSSVLVDARQYAAPASAAGSAGTDGARTFAWYDHDGVLHAEVTVLHDGSGTWLVGAGSYCG